MDVREIVAKALCCCCGEPCRAAQACPAEVPAHWSQQKAGHVLDALSNAGFEIVPKGPPPNAAAGEEELRKMMRDPRYWRTRDPAFVKAVTEGFRRLIAEPTP
jgi:hypothetical protein